ncbi:mechanosensitive ion channel family protein [Hymenobacter artigasi]|uniref:Small-conductance mechanosensitive channel n=1 Tax=Hymenobacter artigasi TaxID=2719616 RepID=A0ABX1HMQ0_9BACT|nr:mechanosensitive ion channel family protein [Hymenobacter artigasi]NKI90266.1 small-conductance mechanosensitive channel [Hymenobacter artigasi]
MRFYTLGLWLLCLSLFITPRAGYAQTPPAKPAATVTKDSVRTLGLSTDMGRLQRLDSLRRQNTAQLAQLQQELLGLKSGPNRSRERELLTQFQALRTVDSMRQVRAHRYIDSLKQFARGYPVVAHADTLFYVYTRFGPFRPQERAALTTSKILELEKQAFFRPDSLRLVPSEQTVDLMYADRVLQSVSDNDALWQNVSKDSLARQHQQAIIRAITAYQKANSVKTYLRQAGLTLLVLLVFFFAVKYINRLFGWVRGKLVARKGTWFTGMKMGTYEFFNADWQLNAVLLLLTILQWTVILLTIYLVLPIVFSIFPGTQNIADMLVGYVLNPVRKILHSVWNYLPNLFTIIVIVAVFRYVLKFIYSLKEGIRQGTLTIDGFYPDWADPTYQIVRVLVFAFALVVVFPYLPGSDSPIFQGVSVFLGFLLTFGSAGSLSNVVAGLVLTYMRAFKIGDRVKIGDVTGDVLEKTLLVTRIRTVKNEEITIPNSSVMSSHTTNYSTAAPTRGLILHTTITIGYDVPWKQVHALMLAAAAQVEELLPDPAPFILQTSLDDFYVSYQLNAYTRAAGAQAGIYSRIHQNIQDQFNAAGVEIMSPHYRAARDGNQTTIPASYLSADYVAPSFRVEPPAASSGPAAH